MTEHIWASPQYAFQLDIGPLDLCGVDSKYLECSTCGCWLIIPMTQESPMSQDLSVRLINDDCDVESIRAVMRS